MKKNLLLLVAMMLSLATFSQKQSQLLGIDQQNITPSGVIRCATNENEKLLQQADPKRMTEQQFEAWLAPLIEQYKATQAVSSQAGGIIYIPVVVHVIHNGDAYGVGENIADEQVESQITVMTQDYRRMMGTRGYNTNAVGADTQIEFVLAKVDPNGNPTNGIDRVNLCKDSYTAASFSAIQTLVNTTVKPATIWDPTQYMNMWCVNWDGSGLLGYAQFPSNSTLGDIATNGGAANTDGVVAGHSYFGSREIFPAGNYGDTTYDKGRTMTHEVGHFLGLRHIWGDVSNCTGDDGCADTPMASTANYECPTGADSCPSNAGLDMIENYMDYTDDSCMSIFTNDQKTRIATVMNNSTRRASLKTSTKDIAIPLFANDAEIKIENSCGSVTPTCAVPNPALPSKIVSLYNRGTANLTSATITYNMDGGTSYTNNWTGNLAPNKFAYVTLANTAVNGTLNVAVTAANGGADQRSTNDTATKAFSNSASVIANQAYTTFVFRLQKDLYASETTWTLKNSAGTTLYSGGPYTNATTTTLPALVTQSWTLPANGCYVFTINDSYGDGICCTSGNGYYDIKANSGAVVVASGSTFALTESKSFTNNTLGIKTNSLNDVYVYPNPASERLNIVVSSEVELPESITIYNYLGQLVVSKNVRNSNDLNVNTSSFSNGVYLITVARGNDTKTLRFVKQ